MSHQRLITSLVLVLVLTGCQPLRDGVAEVIGAPRPAELARAERLAREAGERVEALAEREAQIRAGALSEQGAAEAAAQRAERLRRDIAEVAARLGEAHGPAVDALAATLARMRQTLGGLTETVEQRRAASREHEEMARRAGDALAQQQSELAASRRRLADLRAATTAAIQHAGDQVRAVGQSVQALGAPGAAAVAAEVAAVGVGLLGLLLGGAGAAVYRGKASAQQRAAVNLVRSIERAKSDSPRFKEAFDAVKSDIAAHQSETARRLVAAARG